MKKTYFAPITKSEEMTEEDFIAASLNISGDSGTATLNEEEAAGPALSRRDNNIWDE